MTTEQHLILEAARLARNSSHNWDTFLAALRQHSDHVTKSCIQSSLDELPRAQGRAQATARLLEVLENCKASADKLEGRKK